MMQSQEPPPGQLETASSQSSPKTPCWECQARLEQQQFLQLLGDHAYDSFRRRLPSLCNLLLDGVCKCHDVDSDGFYENDSELTFLKRKIGYALFGKPKAKPSSDNDFTGYQKSHVKEIMKIFYQVTKTQEGNRVLMALIYVSLKGDANNGSSMTYPVFRIPSPVNSEQFWFVDHIGRLYKGWSDFTRNNKLPGSSCCYPRDGIYSADSDGDVELCFGITPASSMSVKVLNAFDTTSTVVGVGASFMVFFPPAAIASLVAGGAVGVYSIARGSFELADRGKHQQSLRDREAFRHWISLAGSSLGIGSAAGAAAARWIAQEGKALSRLVELAVNGLNGSCLLVNGVGIAENFFTLLQQGELNKLQCFQFAASIMFYVHSAVNFKTARSIYNDTQNQILQAHREGLRSKKHQRLFDGLERETLKGESDQLVGRAKIIRDLNYITNKDEYYAQILKSNKSARKNSLPIEKVKFGESQIESGGQPPSRRILANLTVGCTNPAFSADTFPTPACDQMQVHREPQLLLDIMRFLQRVAKSIDVIPLLALLDEVCSKFSCGKYFMRAIRIVMDCSKCKSVLEATNIIEEIVQIAREIYADRWAEGRRPSVQSDADESQSEDSSTAQSNPEELNEVQSSEEIMNDIVEDAGFIPHLLHVECAGRIPVETVFHFPSDHRQWGENGELTPEEYILIGQNALGISNVDSANFLPTTSRDTTSVYFESIGFVTVISYVQEQKVVVKTINFQENFEY